MGRRKLSRKHTTFIPVAQEIRRFAENLPGVAKISSGLIKWAGHAPVRIKLADESGCVLLKIRGQTAVQEVRIYMQAADRVRVLARLVEFIASKGWAWHRVVTPKLEGEA